MAMLRLPLLCQHAGSAAQALLLHLSAGFSFQASRRGAPPMRKVHCALLRAALLLPRCHAVRDVLLVVVIGGGTSATTEPCSPRFFLVLLGAALLPPALLVVSLL